MISSRNSLDNSLRLLNFDDSVIRQARLLSSYDTEIVNFKDIGPDARFWIDKKTKEEIQRAIKKTRRNAVTFLGSGDFHHVSSILINEFDEPLSVIHFDAHPDWNILPLPLNCGSWVRETLKNEKIRKYLLIGLSFLRSMSFSVQAGDFATLKDNRLEAYSYSGERSKLFFRKVPPNISLDAKNNIFSSELKWQGIAEKGPENFFSDVIKRIPTKSVYITIDKDCLKKEYALTNWHEGKMPLEELILALEIIKKDRDIIGADIAGDYSHPLVRGIVKKAALSLNHPRLYSAKGIAEPYVTKLNEETNLKIVKSLSFSP